MYIYLDVCIHFLPHMEYTYVYLFICMYTFPPTHTLTHINHSITYTLPPTRNVYIIIKLPKYWMYVNVCVYICMLIYINIHVIITRIRGRQLDWTGDLEMVAADYSRVEPHAWAQGITDFCVYVCTYICICIYIYVYLYVHT